MKKYFGACLVFLFFGTVFAFSQEVRYRFDPSDSNLSWGNQVSYVTVNSMSHSVAINFYLTNGTYCTFQFNSPLQRDFTVACDFDLYSPNAAGGRGLGTIRQMSLGLGSEEIYCAIYDSVADRNAGRRSVWFSVKR